MEIGEKQRLLEQLRVKYKVAIERYGEGYFNLAELESRITHLLKSGADILGFLQGEKEFYEKLQAKAIEKEKDQQERDELNQRMEEIMAANNARIEKYEDIFFDANATVELRRFAGAIVDFIDNYAAILKHVFGGSREGKELEYLLSDLDRFYVKEGYPSMLFKHYLEELMNKGENGRDDLDRKIMQTGGLALYRLRLTIENLLAQEPEKYVDRKLHLTFSGNKDLYNRWKDSSKRELAVASTTRLQNIIDDFRIGDLVEHAYRQGLPPER